MKKGWLDGVRGSGAGLYFTGAAFLAILAGLSIWSILRGQAPTESVWVLTRTMAPGEVVTAADLSPHSIPAGAAPSGTVQSRDEAVGKRLRFGLAAGDFVRTAHLVDAKSDVAQHLTEMGPAYRLVAIPSSAVPAASRLVRGDRLEVTAVLPLSEKGVSTTVAVALGELVVVDVAVKDDEGVVLAAASAEQIQRLAVSQRTGLVSYALLGNESKAMVDERIRLDQDLVGPTAPVSARAGG
ncbi:MAG TPA: SAF domain-containing protein [Symbiobacteriaceae bacterium]|nr:SAF domain-containing protein [Symbiobacteriaceae bacterium]